MTEQEKLRFLKEIQDIITDYDELPEWMKDDLGEKKWK